MSAADQPTTEAGWQRLRETYTPTTDDVREVWAASQTGSEYGPLDNGQTARAQFDRWLTLLAPAPQPAADTDLRDRLAEVLGDDVYVVGRVWEAWSHGTMTADDFTLATETAVLDDLVTAATSPAADTETEVQWGVRQAGLTIDRVTVTCEAQARAWASTSDESTLVRRTITLSRWEDA